MMQSIYKNLYQFSSYIPPMDFTIHQYLLAAEPSILFAAGTAGQAEAVLPQIKEILNGRKLKYIFVSHIESDECGGVSVIQGEYPDVQVICSYLGARELPGFGYTGKLIPAASETVIRDGDLSLRFFDYPAEVHLQNGIVCLEKNSGIFYSADLMLRFGNGTGQVISEDTVKPSFLAVGHGFCVECGNK